MYVEAGGSLQTSDNSRLNDTSQSEHYLIIVSREGEASISCNWQGGIKRSCICGNILFIRTLQPSSALHRYYILLTIDLTRQFPQFHLGMSIFCLSSLFPLNYYQTEKLRQNKRKMINCLREDCKVKVSCYLVKSVKFPALDLIIQAFLMNHRSKVKVESPLPSCPSVWS